VLEIDERVVAPEAMTQILAGNDLAGHGEQGEQDGERLVLQRDAHAALPQLA
jgi:hypothetical protein